MDDLEEYEAAKLRLMDLVHRWICIVGGLGILIGFVRSREQEDFRSFMVTLPIYLLGVLAYVARRKLPVGVRLVVPVALLSALGLNVLRVMGHLGGSAGGMTVAGLVLGWLVLPRRHAAALSFLVGIGYGLVVAWNLRSGLLLVEPFASINRSVVTWINVTILYLLVGGFLFAGIRFLMGALRENLARLQERERTLDTLLGNLPGAAYREKRSPGDAARLLFVSEGAGTLFGMPAEGLLAMEEGFRSLVETERKDAVARVLDEAVRSGAPFQLEYAVVAQDGVRKWIWEQGRCHRDVATGDMVLEGYIADITAHVQAKEALKTKEAHLRALIDASPDLVWVKDPHGTYLHCNRQFEELIGRSSQEIVGGNDYDFFPAELADSFRHYDRAAMASEQARRNEEEVIFASDGRRAILETMKTTIRAADGSIIGVLGMARDITERSALLEEVRRHRDNLEELVEQRTRELSESRDLAEAASRAKSRFLSNMSHELRTPLNAILGFSRLAAEDPRQAPDQRERMEIVRKAGEHLLAVINDILDLAKIEAGKSAAEPRPFDIGAMTQELVQMLRIRAQEKGIGLDIDQSSSFPRFVRTDPGKLRQILINLVGNGIKFTEAGNVSVKLTARTRSPEERGGELEVEVSDTGSGIPPESLERIFEPFVQLENREGTGLGLAITRKFVEVLGGTLDVESRLGTGTVFRFSIPFEAVDPEEISRLVCREGKVLGLRGSQGVRILVVEDHPDNRRLLEEMLLPHGFEIRFACEGGEGVETTAAWEPGLVLMDRRMPGMDGAEAARRIRALDLRPRPVILAITAHAFLEERQEMIAAGCDGVLAKPFGETELLEAIAGHLSLEPVRAGDPPVESAPVAEVIRERLGRTGVAWKERLREALVRADMESIDGLLEELSALPELQAQLSSMARRFDYAGLLRHLEASVSGAADSP